MYVAIINMPGYLPDTEPEEFETCREAWQYLLSELDYDLNLPGICEESVKEFESALGEIESLDQNLPGIIYAGNYAYSVEYIGNQS